MVVEKGGRGRGAQKCWNCRIGLRRHREETYKEKTPVTFLLESHISTPITAAEKVLTKVYADRTRVGRGTVNVG